MSLGPGVLSGCPPRLSRGQPSGLQQKALIRSSPLYDLGIIPFLIAVRRPDRVLGGPYFRERGSWSKGRLKGFFASMPAIR